MKNKNPENSQKKGENKCKCTCTCHFPKNGWGPFDCLEFCYICRHKGVCGFADLDIFQPIFRIS